MHDLCRNSAGDQWSKPPSLALGKKGEFLEKVLYIILVRKEQVKLSLLYCLEGQAWHGCCQAAPPPQWLGAFHCTPPPTHNLCHLNPDYHWWADWHYPHYYMYMNCHAFIISVLYGAQNRILKCSQLDTNRGSS